MRKILLRVPDGMKRKLNSKRSEGYCLNGFICHTLSQALAEPAHKAPRNSRDTTGKRVKTQ